MNFKFKKWAMALLFATLGSANCWAQTNPQGLVTCRIGSTPVPYTTTYAPGGANSVALSVPISCTQTGANSNNTTAVIVTVNIGNGLNPSSNQNRATGTGSPIDYDFYTNSGCTTETHGSTNPPAAVTVTIPTKNGTGTGNAIVYGCVPLPSPSAMGSYTDTVATIIPAGGVVSSTGNPAVAVGAGGFINVNITFLERCAITMPAGPLAFTYTSFSNAASQASKTYSVTCGSSLTPTMALTDVNGVALTNGTIAGLGYTLALNISGNSTGGTATLPAAATGLATTYRINGNMVANQAGSCAAPATSGSTCTQTISGVHYLTVSW